ncbi:MAG: serine/threonine-protein kinase [Rivularia sp. (in: cyanobacteria)]
MLKTGDILQERYEIKEKLGHNIAHQVWLARDIKIQPTDLVVVKVLLTGGATQWEEFKLFEREAKILKQLNHPYIPKYLDYFPLNEAVKGFVLVQEYIQGESFKDLILQEKRFTESQIKEVAENILNILIYLHELNPPVLHRDIKPSNLIQGKDGHIYLIDFGAVQYRAAVEGSTFTVVGTYGYTPIEQFGGRAVAASDIFALGTTLIHLLTGIAPANLPQEDFKIKFAYKVNLNSNLIQWLEKATEPDLKKRFDTAKTALSGLHSGKVNHGKNSGKLSQESLYSKDLVPFQSDIKIEKFPEELKVKYTVSEATIKFSIIITSLFIAGAFLSYISRIFFVIAILAGIFVLIDYIFYAPIYLHFQRNIFEIYIYKDYFSKKILSRGFIEDIEDVTQSNMYDTDDSTNKSFISIQTKRKEYVFGKGISRAESNWLVEEIKNWLAQS